MRVCPKCRTPYQTTVAICPRDQTPLSTLPQIIQAEIKIPKPVKPGSIVGNYQIVKKLGSGGMGAVYSASHLSLEKEFAIKILREDSAQNPKMLERFYREARSVAKIEHDHVIQISDFGCTPEGLTFLVMELLTGRSLEDLLRTEKKLPVKRAIHIATQICSALAAAHQRKIIHRDLKPENIFLLSNKKDPDYIKVLDFGIAKVLDEESNTVSQIMGTPLYMAPETGAAIDERTDVYALGIIFYRMFTGVLPFEGSNVMDILYKHLVEEPKPLRAHDPMLPVHIERAVLKALAKNKIERHASMEAFIVALCEDDDATRMRSLPSVVRKAIDDEAPDKKDTLQEPPKDPPTSIAIAPKLMALPPIEPVNPTIHLHTEDVIVIPQQKKEEPKREEKIFTLNPLVNTEVPTNELPVSEVVTLEKMLAAPNPTPIYGEVTPLPVRPRQRLLIGLVGFLLIWGVIVGGLLFSAGPKKKVESAQPTRPIPQQEIEAQTQEASLPVTAPVIAATQEAKTLPVTSAPVEIKKTTPPNKQNKQNKQNKKSKRGEPTGPKGDPNLD